jgi:hypothetical protein
MTGHQVVIADVYQLWLHLRTEQHGFGTAGVEAAAWGRVNGAGHPSLSYSLWVLRYQSPAQVTAVILLLDLFVNIGLWT